MRVGDTGDAGGMDSNPLTTVDLDKSALEVHDTTYLGEGDILMACLAPTTDFVNKACSMSIHLKLAGCNPVETSWATDVS